MKRMFILITCLFFIPAFSALGQVKGKKEGVHKSYDNRGKLLSEETYKNGQRDGISKIYDKNGDLAVKAVFKKGELVRAAGKDPKREWGRLDIVFSIGFWLLIGLATFLGWKIFNKVAFRNRPF